MEQSEKLVTGNPVPPAQKAHADVCTGHAAAKSRQVDE